MTLKVLVNTVTHVAPDELARFREWFLDFDSSQQKQQIPASVSEIMDEVRRES